MEKEFDMRYLEMLSEMYPTISAASTEIINLQSIMNLPKGTEHFMSDIHGEYEAFSHVLRNGSGAVRKKINDVFGHTMAEEEKSALATLIYYPTEKIELEKVRRENITSWYKTTLYRLIEVCKTCSSKYTRSKVRKALPKDYAYVIEELITEKPEVLNKEAYYESIVDTIVEIGNAENFIIALAELIQRLVIDHLHIIGDIYDRGGGPHFIMDDLCHYHSLDIQWGNHDIVWMGAAAGHEACIANVLRNSIRYGNLDLLEDGYGINLLSLASFALEAYRDDPCTICQIKEKNGNLSDHETAIAMKMHKAIFVIKLKLEGQLIAKHPEFHMDNRRLLHRIDTKNHTVEIDGKTYPIKEVEFPTVDPENPYELTPGEREVMEKLQASFRHCEKLQRHMNLLLKKGNLYKVYNGNLLYHGCMPLDENGNLKKVNIYGEYYSGKKLFDVLESYVRKAYFSLDPVEKQKGMDLIWFLWCSPDSPLYGRSKIATFERYFLLDGYDEAKQEVKNYYYEYLNRPGVADMILKEFGLSGPETHIINGHVPVQRKAGEKPVRANGKVIIIDGGFCKAYRKTTGIAGYTLIYNSYALTLTAHDPFVSAEEAIEKELDMVSHQEAVEFTNQRKLVGDTDDGKQFETKIRELKALIHAYRKGDLREKGK